MLIFSSQSKITGVNKMLWKSLAMLKCESRSSIHAVQYKWQPGSVRMSCSYYFKNDKPRHFVPMLRGTTSLTLFIAFS